MQVGLAGPRWGLRRCPLVHPKAPRLYLGKEFIVLISYLLSLLVLMYHLNVVI